MYTPEEVTRMKEYKKPFIEELNAMDPVSVLGLTKSRKGEYVCPMCGSGTGHNQSGALNIGRNGQKAHITCFAGGCFDRNGHQGTDLFGAIKIITGKSENEILQEHFPNYNIKNALNSSKSFNRGSHTRYSVSRNDIAEEIAPVDYTDFLLECSRNNTAEGGSYLIGRGISLATQQKFGVGLCSEWLNPSITDENRQYIKGKPYTIFPTGKNTYTARYSGSEPIEERYKKQKVGRGASVFGKKQAEEALKVNPNAIVVIVEGESDCLSIWECGGIAIATGSVTNWRKAVEFAKEHREAKYIISYDNDGNTNVLRNQTELDNALKEYKITCECYYMSAGYKDVNDLLVANRGLLEKEIANASNILLSGKSIISNAAYMDEFEDFVENRSEPIKTGFNNLDKHLNGGIYTGQLITIGAESSMGKTTIMLQIADNIAEQGNDVLFFSLEQSRFELIAKSLSREYYRKMSLAVAGNDNLIAKHRKSSVDISDKTRLKYFDKYEENWLREAKKAYSQTIAPHIYINEGRSDNGEVMNISEIESVITEFINLKGTKPVVFIDYLQILSPNDTRITDETTKINKAVTALRRMCRDMNITIVIISSLNRESYANGVKAITESSFKQSGTIEYSTDILIAYEYRLVGSSSECDRRVEEQKDPRETRMVVLKNRNGQRGGVTSFKYYPLSNYIIEDEAINKAATKIATDKANRAVIKI